MSPLSLSLVLVDPACPGQAPSVVAASLDSVLAPLVEALAAHPNVRVALHLAGPTTETLAARGSGQGSLLRQLGERSRAGQLELLGGPRWGASLAHTPWADVQRQLRNQLDWLVAHVGTPVRGAWSPHGAWDPLHPRILAPLGLRYTFAPGRLAAASGVPTSTAGPLRVTRGGASVQVLLVDQGLGASAATDPAALVGALRLRGLQGHHAHVAVVSLAHLNAARVTRLISQLAASTVRAVVPWQLVERARSQPAALLAGVPLDQAVWRLPPELAQELQGASSRWVAGPPWELALGALPAAGRLQDACDRVSDVLIAAGRQLRAKPDPAQAEKASQAADLMDRAHTAGAREPGPGGSAWDGRVRATAWRNLLTAERWAARVLGAARTSVRSNGDDEPVVVRTPDLWAVVDPRHGGTLRELHLWGQHPLLNTLERRLPPTPADSDLPVLVDDEGFEDTDTARTAVLVDLEVEDELTDEAPVVAVGPVADRLPRVAFQDRFFGTPLTLSNLSRSQPPEIGDFADGAYRLERAEVADGGVEVVLGREGAVRPGPDTEGLVRITKTWRFSGHAPLLGVDYLLSNRSREPVRSRFGVVLTLNVDSAVGPSRVVRFGEGRPAPQRVASQGRELEQIAVKYADLGFEVLVRASPAVTAWAYPVYSTVPCSPRVAAWAQPPEQAFQGLCLTVVWPMDLWGEERRRVSLSLEARSLGSRW